MLPTSEKLLLNVEGLNDARTTLADFFRILLDDEEGEAEFAKSAGHLALPAFNR